MARAGGGPRHPPGVGGGRLPRGPRGGVAADQLDAEGLEVLGEPLHELAGVRGILHLLGQEDVERAARESQAARQRLVEYHADAVPVRGGRDGLAGRLLGGHE